MKKWTYVTATLGTISMLVSCSSAPHEDHETTSTASQPDSIAPALQWSARVCQLIGDTDYSRKPDVVLTKNLSEHRFGVRGTDEGSAIVDTDDQKIFFYFGDTNPDPFGKGYDVVGWSDLSRPDDGCPNLTFGAFYDGQPGDITQSPIVTVDGQVEPIAQAPAGGFYNPDDKRLYVFFNVFRQGQSLPNAEGRTVLTWADPGLPHQLHSVNTSPFNGPNGMTAGIDSKGLPASQFLTVAPIVVSATEVPGVFSQIDPQSNVVLIYGSTGPFRGGRMQLAAVPLDQLANAQAYRFRTSDGWSADHTQAADIFNPEETTPCDGEVTITHDDPLGAYMIGYICGTPPIMPNSGRGVPSQGFFLRTSSTPVGPWSAPTVLFDEVRDGAIGRYIHDGNARAATYNGGPLERTRGDVCSNNGGLKDCCSEPASALSSDCINNLSDEGPWTPNFPFSCISNQTEPPFFSCGFPGDAESSPTGSYGCCTDPAHCCDLTYTDETYDQEHTKAWGSSQAGHIYNPYFISPYTRTTSTLLGTSVPSTLEVSYNLSTWNPYVVDVVRSSISFGDADGDTVPDGADNCPTVRNFDQANCNLESEQAWNVNNPADQVQMLGDACDPVPCPRSNSDTPTSITDVQCFPARRDPSANQLCEYHEIHDQIDVTPVGSYAAAGVDPTVTSNIEHVVPDVNTHGRFCEIASIVKCTNSIVSKEQDRELSFFPDAESEVFNFSHPWHRITLTTPPGTGPAFTSDRNEKPAGPFKFNYGGGLSGGSIKWAYNDDNTFWLRLGIGAVLGTPDPSSCSTSSLCLNGRLWIHGDSDVGQTNDRAPDGSLVGIHGATFAPRSLSNYYFESEPEFPTGEVIPGVGVLPRGYRFAFRTPGDPGPDGRTSAPWQKYEQGYAAPIFVAGQQLLGLRQTSALVDAASSFGASFARELRGNQLWINAPGPSATEANAPMAIELSDDGTTILGTANLAGGKVLLGRAVELVAEPGTDADEDLGGPASISIPNALSVVSGNAGNGTAILSLQISNLDAAAGAASRSADAILPTSTIRCTYAGGASTAHPIEPQDRAQGQRYNFISCDSGANAKSTVQIVGAQLHVVSGDDRSGTTQVESSLNAIETTTAELAIRSNRHRGCTAKAGPRPRRDFVATYAPTLNGIFLVGGRSRWNERLSDAWFKPLDGPWQQIDLPNGALGRVLDAAYSPADGRLWVMDDADGSALDIGRWSCHHRRTVRLLRIERERGSMNVVASATPRGLFDQRGLLTDRDGQILVYASSDVSRSHQMVRLVPDSNAFDAFATPRLAKALLSKPVVDYRGYTFIEAASRGSSHAVALDRLKGLPFSPATMSTWTELLQ